MHRFSNVLAVLVLPVAALGVTACQQAPNTNQSTGQTSNQPSSQSASQALSQASSESAGQAPSENASQNASQSTNACDRACLAVTLMEYIDSLVAHDPKEAPLADNVRFTEDGVQMPVGDGLWKTATLVYTPRADFLDVQGGTAAVQAVVEEGGTPELFAARLRVVNGLITEIETMVVRDKTEGVLFAPEALETPSPGLMDWPPKSALMPRDKMVDIALRYPAGLRAGSFVKSDAPFAKDAYRLENGVKMAGPGCTFEPPSCEDIRNQPLPKLPNVKTRVIAVDEQIGTVLLWEDFGKGALPGKGNEDKTLVTFEAFKVYGGEIHAVEAIFEGAPPDRGSGWQ